MFGQHLFIFCDICHHVADFCSSSFLYYKYGCWADLVDGIEFAGPFGGKMNVSKVGLLHAGISHFFEVL